MEPASPRISDVFTRDRIINDGLHQGQPTSTQGIRVHMQRALDPMVQDLIRAFPSHAVIIRLFTWQISISNMDRRLCW